MRIQPDSPRLRFGYLFVSLGRAWRRVVDLHLAEAGLSDATWAPLVNLARHGDDISQTELAARVGLDGSSLVRLIDLLAERGFVERQVDPADRRARRLLLTEAGRAEVERILTELGRIETELLADVEEAEIGRMLDAMERIKARTEAMLDRETSK